jgi:hypothetical protein
MKSLRFMLSVMLLAAAPLLLAQSGARKSFDQLKSLEGSWEGKNSEDHARSVTFRDTAGGSAVISEIHGHGADEMVSMIHLDGNRLMLTHYCSAGNQPRMTASTSADGKVITFEYLDATNLAAPDAGHMQRVAFTIVDAKHHTEEWTFNNHGKEMKEFFDLHRSEVAQK